MRYVAAPALRSRARSASIVRGMDLAPLQVDRHVRGAVDARPVAVGVVVGDPVVEEVAPPAERPRPRPPRAASIPSGSAGSGISVVSSSSSQRGPGRGVDRAAPAVVGPGPRERREDAGTGSPEPLVTRPGATAYGEPVRTSSMPCSASASLDRCVAAAAVGAVVGRDVDPRRRRPPRAASTTRRTGIAADDRQPGLPLPERGVEGAQRVGEVGAADLARPGPTAQGRARTAAARRRRRRPRPGPGCRRGGGRGGTTSRQASPHHHCSAAWSTHASQ